MTASLTNSTTIPSTTLGSWRIYPSPNNIPTHATVITHTRPTTLEPENPTPYAQDRLDIQLTPTRNTTPSQPTEPEILPPAENYVGRLAVTLFEVLRGRRPLSTLARFVSPKIHGSLDRRRHRAGSTMKIKPVRLRTVVGSTPKNGIHDAAVILEEEGIIHTMALRITQNRGRWIVTELHLD